MNLQEKTTGFRLSEIEQKAYQLLVADHERIDIEDFSDLYDKSSVEKDRNLVATIEEGFVNKSIEEKDLKKISDVLEMLLPELVELYDWLGSDVFIINTSKYDDFVNKTDLVAEFLKDGMFNYLGLAIDVTFSGDNLRRKINGIADEIKSGQLSKVKYFKSGGGDFRGELSNIARVVIGVNRRTINELAEAKLTLESLMNRKKNPTPSEEPENLTRQIKEIKTQLANHPFQFEILNQLAIQLEKFRDYANQTDKSQIAEKYDAVLAIIQGVKNEKEKNHALVKSAGALERPDPSMDLISLRIEEGLNRILEL